MVLANEAGDETPEITEYGGPVGGWGSLEGTAGVFGKNWDSPAALNTLRRQNKPNGFILLNPNGIARVGREERQMISLVSDADDGITRHFGPLKVTPFKLPEGCARGYYPETNRRIPAPRHDIHSKTPATKSVPVRIRA